MSFTDEELKAQEYTIKKKLLIVFIPISIMLFCIAYYQNTSVVHNKEKYEQSNNKAFEGIIIKKKQEGNYPRALRYIVLDNYHDEQVTNEIYYKLNIGDKVVKRKGEDTVYFFLKNGEKLTMDYNKYIREDYQKLSQKKLNVNCAYR